MCIFFLIHIYNREEEPVGNWTLNVYDVDHADATGFMLNWTLSLFGELDPTFVGTPIHLSTGIHEDKEDKVTVSTTATAKPTTSDNTPSRPTRIKPEKSTKTKSQENTSTSSVPSSTHDNNSNLDTQTSANNESESVKASDGYLTIIYSVVGSVAILAIASVIFIYKRNGWKTSSAAEIVSPRRPDGYEFDVLQPLTELDEEDESESDNEVDRLVRNR